MSKIKLVAIDLAKRCYQMGAIDEQGKILYNRKLSPAKFALAIQQLEPTIIAGPQSWTRIDLGRSRKPGHALISKW